MKSPVPNTNKGLAVAIAALSTPDIGVAGLDSTVREVANSTNVYRIYKK